MYRNANNIEIAIVAATRLHAGQMDKLGTPYIYHPLRVMEATTQIAAKKVAVLHDVLEDTPTTITELVEMCSLTAEEAHALLRLTKPKYMPYHEYLYLASKTPLAAEVKLADMLDNAQRTLSNKARFLPEDYERLVVKYATGLFFFHSDAHMQMKIIELGKDFKLRQSIRDYELYLKLSLTERALCI